LCLIRLGMTMMMELLLVTLSVVLISS
jgi:hypothetical protein